MAEIKQLPVSTQPGGTAPMIAGGNKNILNRPIGADGRRDWTYGLFEFFDACGLCCFATWCPCFVYTHNKQHLRSLQANNAPLPPGTEQTDADCCIYCGLTYCSLSWILQLGPREDIRLRYAVRGDAVTDCLISAFCRPCALTQERRELELEEGSFRQ